MLSRFKKYKAITNHEKQSGNGYLNEETQSKRGNNESQESQPPKHAMRVRKFRVFC